MNVRFLTKADISTFFFFSSSPKQEMNLGAKGRPRMASTGEIELSLLPVRCSPPHLGLRQAAPWSLIIRFFFRTPQNLSVVILEKDFQLQLLC